ncbi:MAG TPA: nucleotide exchange factor GrpE [Thermoanaerobaculia bacterium]|nr:nucleotide exchange factor GrpE [Thermoanaerobaculia bacterium]
MADEERDPKTNDAPEIAELDLDGQVDVESALREAMAAMSAAEEAGAKAPDPADPAEPAKAEDEVAALKREVADLQGRSLRTLADFDNFRKRSERDRQDLKRYALLEPMRELLAVVDNLERALQAGGSADDLKKGVEMILRGMVEFLRRHGVREVEAQGAPFDPAVHEAVLRLEDPTVKAPTVAEELQRGYLMHDRLLRPAMVKVAVPADPAKGAAVPAVPEA